MRPLIALAATAMILAGCGTTTKTTTKTTTAPTGGHYSARNASIKTSVESTITNQVTSNEAAAGDGSTFDPSTSASCIALSNTQLSCTVLTRTGEEQWVAIVDQDTGAIRAQQQS